MADPTSPPAPPVSKTSELFRTVRLALILGALLFAAWFFFVRPVESATDLAIAKVGSALERITGQKTTIVAGHAELLDSTDVAELSLVRVKMKTVRSMQDEKHLWKIPLGKKSLQIAGTFLVTAGYDLSGGETLTLSHDGKVVTAQFPQPKILSAELIELETLTAESGWYNELTNKDRDNLIAVLRDQMLSEAQKSGLPELSAQYLDTRLKDLLNVETVELQQLP